MDFIDQQLVGPRRARDLNERERLAEAAHRRACAKHKGRNHWRNWERRRALAVAKKVADAKVELKAVRYARYTDAVRDYWRGLRDAHPGKPA